MALEDSRGAFPAGLELREREREGMEEAKKNVVDLREVAAFACRFEMACDEYDRTFEALKRQRAENACRVEESRKREREVEELEKELQKQRRANDALRDQIQWFGAAQQQQEREEQTKDVAACDLNNNNTKNDTVEEDQEQLKELKRECYHLHESLKESEQNYMSLQRHLEGKSAIIDAVSKELCELQERLSKGWKDLNETKTQICDLSKCQYDNVLRLKQVDSYVRENQDQKVQLEKTLRSEQGQGKELVRTKKELEWKLRNSEQQVRSLLRSKEELEDTLERSAKDAKACLKLSQQREDLKEVIDELQKHIPAHNAIANDSSLPIIIQFKL